MPKQEYQENYKKGYSKGYGKRPLWQWILIYVVIGGLIYFAVYYFFFASKGKSLYSSNSGSNSPGVYQY